MKVITQTLSNKRIEYRAQLFCNTIVGRRMNIQVSAAVVCSSRLLRDVVKENLEAHRVPVLTSAQSFNGLNSSENPHIVVAVETYCGELGISASNAVNIARKFERWLVIGSSEHGSAFQRLRSIRSDISGVPLDIGKEEMYHAVMLAAHASPLLIGESFRRRSTTERHMLNDAHLNEEQWQILKLLADGASNKTIAKNFDCEESQVKSMIRRLLQAIDATNRTQAAVIAARAGL